MANDTRPSIAEKVRFWEEQDRINQALIPRVFQMHETVRDLSEQASTFQQHIAAAEARCRQTAQSRLAEEAQRLEARIAATDARCSAVGEQLETTAAQVARHREIHAELRTHLAEQQSGLRSLGTQADALQERLTAGEARLISTEAALAQHRVDHDALRTEVRELSSLVEALAVQLTTFEQLQVRRWEGLETRTRQLEAAQSELPHPAPAQGSTALPAAARRTTHLALGALVLAILSLALSLLRG